MNFLGNVLTKFCKKDNNLSIFLPNQYVELKDSESNLNGALLIHDTHTKFELLNYLQNAKYNNYSGHNGKIADTIVDKLGLVSATLASGLQAGQLMQIVGTPALTEGLKNGSMSLLQTTMGSTGTVVSNSTNKIVGQLRFSPANASSLIAPLAIWQVLNAIAGAHQLAKINKRLDELQRSVEAIIYRMHANVFGRLSAATSSLTEIEKQYQIIGYFSDDMSTRLSIATQEIQTVFFEQGYLINRFIEKSKNILRNTNKKAGASSANQLLKEETQTYMNDANFYISASQASLKANRCWIYHDLEKVPGYISQRTETMNNEIAQIQQSLSDMAIIEELSVHSKTCLNEMNWFSKNILNRKLKKEINDRPDNSINEPISNTNEAEPSILIWKDDNQKINCINIECKIE